MRVVVKISSHAYAELVAELERVPARERAERLRVLASIGFVSIKCGHATVISPELSLDSATKSRSVEDTRFRKIRGRLQSAL